MERRLPGKRLSPQGLRLVPLTVALALTGCNANFLAPFPLAAPPPPAPAMPVAQAPAPPLPVIQEVDFIDISHRIGDALVAELIKNHPSFHRQKPLLVTNLVNRSDLDSTSELGMLISDHISSRLTQQGFAVLEARIRRELAVRQREGEFILSRDIERLSGEFNAFAVVAGTYTRTMDMLDFTVRIIQVNNSQVLASIDAKAPLSGNMRELLVETGGPPVRLVTH